MKSNCTICTEDYDLATRYPLLFSQCGHSFCKACLTLISEVTIKTKTKTIKCPACRIDQPFDIGKPKLDDNFLKNYALANLLEMSTEDHECTHKDHKYVCLDMNCSHKNTCCFECVSIVHKNCNDDFIEKVKDVIFQKSNEKIPIVNFDLDFVKSWVKIECDEYCKMVCAIVEETHKKVEEEIVWTQNLLDKSDSFLIHPKHFFEVSKIRDHSYKIGINFKKWDALSDTAESARNKFILFSDEIRNSLQIKIVEIIRDFSEFNIFKDLNSREFKTELAKKKNQLMHFPLPAEMKPLLPFKFANHFNRITEFTKNNKVIFVDKKCINKNEKRETVLQEILNEQFKTGFLSLLDLESSISCQLKNKLNENYQVKLKIGKFKEFEEKSADFCAGVFG